MASAWSAVPVTSLLMAPHVTDAVFAGESLDGPTALGLADRGRVLDLFRCLEERDRAGRRPQPARLHA